MLGAQFHDNIAFEIEGGLLYNSVYQNQLDGISATDMTVDKATTYTMVATLP
jgi:hypothetical protein